jgi:hypothetical protein
MANSFVAAGVTVTLPNFFVDATGTDIYSTLTTLGKPKNNFVWSGGSGAFLSKWFDINSLYGVGANQKVYCEIKLTNTGGQVSDGQPTPTVTNSGHVIGISPITGDPTSFHSGGINVFGLQLGASDGTVLSGYGGVYNWPTTTYPGFLVPVAAGDVMGTTYNHIFDFHVAAGNPSTNDVIGFCLDTANFKVWFRNITKDGSGTPQWNYNSTDNPATNTGGIDLSPVDLTILPFPWYIYYSTSNYGGPSALSPGSGTIVAKGTETVWNFGQNPYVGFLPTGFSNWPPLANYPIVTGRADKQKIDPVVVPYHPEHPMTDTETGQMSGVWTKFFQRESAKPGGAQILMAGINPYVFNANIGGTFWIADPVGSVKSVSITRGKLKSKNSMTFSASHLTGAFPLANGDTISVFYTQPPQTLAWMPGSHSGSVP